MNKFWKFSGIFAVLVAVIAFAGVTSAYAQGPNQPDGMTPTGMNQAQHGSGAGMGLRTVDEAVMHAAIADALGMTIEEFEAAVAQGETAFTLTDDFTKVQAAMDAVHEAAFQQAIADGLVSQEQAEWMLSHRGGEGGQSGLGEGMNRGQSNGSTGMMGRGAGSNGSQTGECQIPTP